METLKNVLLAIEDIASDPSHLTKEYKIKKYLNLQYFQEVVKYAYDYNKRYHMTEVRLIEHDYDLTVNGLFEYLDYLASLNGATEEMKYNLSVLSSMDKETNILVNRIINKDLRCGASENTFKEFVKDLPIFEIMTCQKIISKFLKWNNGKPYYWSIKKNGVRTISTVFEDYVESHLSRSGLEYSNFSVFDHDLIKIAKIIVKESDLVYPIKIDGEAIAAGKHFEKAMKQVRKGKDADLTDFNLCVFDNPINNKILKDRYNLLEYVFNNHNFEKLELLEHKLCNYNEQELEKLSEDVVKNSPINTPTCNIDEGIVLKIADSFYEYKEHSRYWCKNKPTPDTLDLEVTGFYFGKKGKKYENLVGGLIVNYKGKEVRVGGGLSDQQRIDFLDHLPKLIEVKFKEITPDGSLREPRMASVRDDKWIVSDE